MTTLEPEEKHEGLVTLNHSDDKSWVTHNLTGEKAWCPPSSEEWKLWFQDGFGLIYTSMISLWLSGPNGLFKKSLHTCRATGKMFVYDRTSGKRDFLDDLRKQFKNWKCMVPSIPPTPLWLFELYLPFEDATVFFQSISCSTFGLERRAFQRRFKRPWYGGKNKLSSMIIPANAFFNFDISREVRHINLYLNFMYFSIDILFIR